MRVAGEVTWGGYPAALGWLRLAVLDTDHTPGSNTFITKGRTALITLAASASLGIAAIMPAASQTQWHTYGTAGTCITHSNYAISGVHACGPADIAFPTGQEDATKPAPGEDSDAQAVQNQITQLEGGCPN